MGALRWLRTAIRDRRLPVTTPRAWVLAQGLAAAVFLCALTNAPAASGPLTETLPPSVITETVVADAGDLIVALAFAPHERLFFTLKGGFGGNQVTSVRIVEAGQLRATPFLTTVVNSNGERGLLGIALDPQFEQNRYVYIYKTAPASETGTGFASNRVVRYTEDTTTQTAVPGSAVTLLDVPIRDGNEVATNHNGGNLHFGPDGRLYVTIGDYGARSANAQDLSVAMGKIHRLNADGTIPSDNPFASGPAGAVRSIWTYGNRNSFDFAFDPTSARMFFTENGPSCDDEVNLGQAGGNYGWPNACGQVPSGTIAPLLRYTSVIAITGIDFYQGPISEWQGALFWCAFNSGTLYRATLDSARTEITSTAVVTGAPPCTVDVQHGPDGALYLTAGSKITRLRSLAALRRSAYLPVLLAGDGSVGR